MRLFLLWTLVATIAFANIQVVISNENKVVNVTKKELTDLYLGKTDTIQGVKVTPVDNKENYKEFYRKVLKKSPDEIRAYWVRAVAYKMVPPKKMSAKEIQKLMKKKRVIAYGTNKLNGKIIMSIK